MQGNIMRSLLLLLGLFLFANAAAGEIVWIDVRTAEEYSAGHVRGAVNIPYDEITDRIVELSPRPDEPIYLYCRSGRRSGIAKKALEDAGFRQVVNVGGLEDAFEKASSSSSFLLF